MQQKLKVGILGAGHIAQKMATTLMGMKEAELYAVAARELSRAEQFADEFHAQKAYGNYEALADDPDIDLIYIATPHSHHFGPARMCLLKGKSVLCEKAFTANAREAEELIRIAQEKQVFLAEAIWTRYMPFSRTIRELTESGIIGKPMMLTASLGYPIAHKERIVRLELCGGALYDLGVYPINFALMTFGNDLEKITSTCMKNEAGVDMQNSITFTYRDGRMAVMQTTAFCASDRQGIISGDKGYLVIDNINNPQQAVVYNTDHQETGRYTCPPQITGFEYQVLEAAEAIRQGAIEPASMPHAETLRVMRMLDSLRQEWGIRFPMDE
ncbi:Gfo/Idh/MocA family oxidoreductase [Phocaeicola barnesiae]|uniref:Gfo/Idh/MocA family protein n=1 Tax=Phocaeicola barnesiae TaxID=376804 RepID=UPI0025A3B80C|nr:Gfo/Idh/MocA family oxidoreductase [Phocaeicola barnesiae]MDM8232843.1 Gfo/Idh/MocA family oxidoreductase [Phocaeicola barnesiae]